MERWGEVQLQKRGRERRPEREREIEEWREREKGYNYGMTWHGMD